MKKRKTAGCFRLSTKENIGMASAGRTTHQNSNMAPKTGLLPMNTLHVSSVVPSHDIFSDTTPEHMKWQKFHRTVFCLASEFTFELGSPATKTSAQAAMAVLRSV